MRLTAFTLAAAGAVLLGSTAHAALLSGIGGAPGAIPGGTVETFTGAPAGATTSITLSGVTYSGIGGTNLTIDSAFGGSFNTAGQYIENNRSQGSFTGLSVSFAAPVSAFTFNWGASDETWVLSAYDGSNTLIESHNIGATFGSNAGDYFGISAAGIQSFTIVQGTPCSFDCPIDYVLFDDLTYARSATTVPAPMALSLFAVGLLGLAAARRR